MKKVPVVIAWIVNAFENSSQHSEYYVDLKTGDVKFFSPLDFPEHIEIMEKLDKQTSRYIKLPKIEKAFSLRVKKDYIATIVDEDLRLAGWKMNLKQMQNTERFSWVMRMNAMSGISFKMRNMLII
ncbi:MAG: UPF0158 family protein [Candidatus Syntrophopropionicum ammoniitolerans]